MSVKLFVSVFLVVVVVAFLATAQELPQASKAGIMSQGMMNSGMMGNGNIDMAEMHRLHHGDGAITQMMGAGMSLDSMNEMRRQMHGEDMPGQCKKMMGLDK